MTGSPNILTNTMATNTGTLTQLRGIDGEWMTNAQLLALTRQIQRQAIDNQRLEAEAQHPPRHPATPGYFEYPTFDESADMDPAMLWDHDVYRCAEEKAND